MVNRLIKNESEGGCGVIGFAATAPIAGKHLLQPLIQMHNRGNGKGGGIAAVGCFPDFHDFYAIHIGYLDPASRRMVEDEFITPFFSIEYVEKQSSIDDHREIPGLEIRPPEVWRYFCRVKEDVLKKFAKKGGIEDLVKAEDEFVYRNSHALNQKWYVSLEDKKAFVLSHGKDMMVLKGVGYAEQLAKYYQLENFKAYVWIGHQRYPTRGRVWHPGGAHPFVGLNDALVHNGDFANYQSICDYLRQRDIHPQFLTDTEVAALLFDFYTRVLEYPLEYTIEALAPTTERDFDMLPKIKQRLYRAIRTAHIHGSPDGPWFFIIARNDVKHHTFQLIGITDTSMLRPQVFALSEGEVSIGVVASEKQAIDALLESLSQENEKICSVADLYWNSRGGSHTDGGAFIFSLSNTDDQIKEKELICTDKFGKVVAVAKDQVDLKGGIHEFSSLEFKDRAIESKLLEMIEADGAYKIFQYLTDGVRGWDYADFLNHCRILARIANESDLVKTKVIEGLTLLRDRHYHTGHKKRKWLLAIIDQSLEKIFSSLPRIETHSEGRYILLESGDRKELIRPANPEQILVINAQGFPPEGEDSVARLMVAAHEKGFKQFIAYNLKGDRFLGCGLGPNTNGVRIDLYGSSGDYTASGLDGAEVYIHGDAQDQVGQILKSGKIVIHGNVGQTFLYGAKGGVVYVLGNTAGRPLINAVGSIRAIINGTCLDYAAESFMAGDVLGGGFVLINGFRINVYGEVLGVEDRFPGSNFFSLASGGAGYLNDPYHSVSEDQLNGAEFAEFTQEDWNIIYPYLQENEGLFGITIDGDILTVDRTRKWPQEVYRKVVAKKQETLGPLEF